MRELRVIKRIVSKLNLTDELENTEKTSIYDLVDEVSKDAPSATNLQKLGIKTSQFDPKREERSREHVSD